MSGGEGRKLSSQDIQLVQNRIEQCLQHYMSKKEVINALIIQDNIEPRFTELVWQRLEEENQEFFKAYYMKLLVKDQIMEFNRLLSEQVELMRRIGLSGINPVLTSNGSHVSPSQLISPPGAAHNNARPLKTEDMQQTNIFHNCGPSIAPCVQGSVDGRKIDVSPSLFLSQTMNGKLVKTEGGGGGGGGGGAGGFGGFEFTQPSNYLETRPLMGDASVSSFSSVESNAQHLNEPLLDGDTSSFGFLAQIPQSFGLPELPADFTGSSDLLESYCRPPFLPTDANNFGNPHGDVERLDPESESLRFQCFGGD